MDSEGYVLRRDFPFSNMQGLEGMGKIFQQFYLSDRRLHQRAFWDVDTKQVKVAIRTKEGLKEATVAPRFLRTVQNQLRLALERRYAHYAFFPDMGHSHFLIPEKSWSTYSKIPEKDWHLFYEKVMDDEGLRIFYHTAEQLDLMDGAGDLLDDRLTQWRYFSRNILGPNTGAETYLEVVFVENPHSFNTVRSYPKHIWYGAGFYLHSSRNGCFSYRLPDGAIHYFDFGFHSFPPE